ncbi:MAG: HD domain-containing protein [Acidaminococcaceae bacterium]
MKFDIPVYVQKVLGVLTNSGFEAYVVGGAVRDLLLEKIPEDYDVVTNARPDEIKLLAERNGIGVVAGLGQNFGVVMLTLGRNSVEVAAFRNETYGEDAHRPAEVWYCDKLEDDLGRRDFTINAMALDSKGKIIDCFDGLGDLQRKILKTVGNPEKRFEEDALRMFRACRFLGQLGFAYDLKMKIAIKRNLAKVSGLSLERVRTELNKMICGPYAEKGMGLMISSGLAGENCRYRADKTEKLVPILPELVALVGVKQNPAYHQYDVWHHTLTALTNSDHSLEVGWAIIFHDVAKGCEGIRGMNAQGEPTDYGHDILGAQIAADILTRLRFPLATVQRVSWLVKNHMRFGSNIDRGEAVTWRWIRQTAREGNFRVTKEMADAFKQLVTVCIADLAATTAHKQELISAQMYGGKLISMAYEMPVHTTDLNVNGGELSQIVTNKKALAEIMPLLLRRVQDGELSNNAAALKLAAQVWYERKITTNKTKKKTP